MTTLGPGQLLFDFVRHWSRRSASGGGTLAEQGRLVLVTEAVNALVNRGEPATVNSVASELGIDQSGASRLIKSATDVGYLGSEKSPEDGRRRVISITPPGRDALMKAHQWHEEVFAQLTEGWSEKTRNAFHSAMADLISRSYTMNS